MAVSPSPQERYSGYLDRVIDGTNFFVDVDADTLAEAFLRGLYEAAGAKLDQELRPSQIVAIEAGVSAFERGAYPS